MRGPAGTGLGCLSCKELHEAHQGDIDAENSPEGGAMFYDSRGPWKHNGATRMSVERTVLVIDDEPGGAAVAEA